MKYSQEDGSAVAIIRVFKKELELTFTIEKGGDFELTLNAEDCENLIEALKKGIKHLQEDDIIRGNSKCPVCNFECGFLPWDNDLASLEICPTCGIQFGYEDAAGGDKKFRQKIYEVWNSEWIKNGSKSGWKPTKDQIINIITQAKQKI